MKPYKKGDTVCRVDGLLKNELATVINDKINFQIQSTNKKKKTNLGGFIKVEFQNGGRYIYPREAFKKQGG